MGRDARRLLTNFSKGLLGPEIEGRPDLSAYFEGCSELTNWLLLRQGGITRRPGLRFIAEVKDHSKDVVLFPHEASAESTYVLEAGPGYLRFYKDKAQVRQAGFPVEKSAPWTEEQLREIMYTQSVDVQYFFHRDIPQHQLTRISGDTAWSMSPIMYVPPPSFEDDTDISGGTITLTPGATSGTGVIFAASAPVFLAGDVGRQIVHGSSRGTIVDFGASAGDIASPNDHVRVDIVSEFSTDNAIPAGEWLMRGSPQASIDIDKKGPVHAKVTITTNPAKNVFRSTDVGKYITLYGGLVKITAYNTAQSVSGEILSELVDADADNPAATPNWTLEVESWTAENGYPAMGEFFEGRLFQASTRAQPVNFWGSAIDDFDDYSIGNVADRAIDYAYAARSLNQFEWIADGGDLFFGSGGAEIKARGGRDDVPMGGDEIPLVKAFNTLGSAPIMPIVVGGQIIFVERSRRQIHVIHFDLEKDNHGVQELTAISSEVTGEGVRFGPVAHQKRLNPRVWWVSEDGYLLVLTYFPAEKVVGFSTIVTDGVFEAVTAVAHGPHNDHVYVVVKRTVNGQERKYIEVFDDHAEEMEERYWHELQTDSARCYNLEVITNVFVGLEHLEGKTVDVIVDGSFRGTRVVTAGQVSIDLDEAGTANAEIGLHYDADGATMRPAIDGAMVEGQWRAWKKLWVRLLRSRGGKINGKDIDYDMNRLGELLLFTGDRSVTASGGGYDERITFSQHLPYPMTILALFGDIEFGES